MAGNRAAIVIRQAELERGDTQEIQPPADIGILIPPGIPLPENDYRWTRTARGEKSSIYDVVLGPLRGDRAGKCEDPCFAWNRAASGIEAIIARRRTIKPLIALSDGALSECLKKCSRVGLACAPATMLKSPRKSRRRPIRLIGPARVLIPANVLFEKAHEANGPPQRYRESDVSIKMRPGVFRLISRPCILDFQELSDRLLCLSHQPGPILKYGLPHERRYGKVAA